MLNNLKSRSGTVRVHTLRLFVLAMLCLVCVVLPRITVAASKVDSALAIEKIAVFPLLYKGERGERVDESTARSFDDAWWQVRDELTSTGRFVVASRAFLQKNDSFQPRGQLTTGDAVILGRYVEAEALMTMDLRDRTLTVAVWESNDGTLVWSQSVELHPSVLLREQIAKVARALVREFIASFPYQATTLQDSFSRQAIAVEGGKRKVRVAVANGSVTVGDSVQWVAVSRDNLDPLFQGGAKVDVIAEGTISEIQDRMVVVELTRAAESRQIRAGTLVNLPKEQARLKKLANSRDSATSAAVISLLAAESAIDPEAKQLERKKDESGPFATTLSLIGSLAVILLLAF